MPSDTVLLSDSWLYLAFPLQQFLSDNVKCPDWIPVAALVELVHKPAYEFVANGIGRNMAVEPVTASTIVIYLPRSQSQFRTIYPFIDSIDLHHFPVIDGEYDIAFLRLDVGCAPLSTRDVAQFFGCHAMPVESIDLDDRRWKV